VETLDEALMAGRGTANVPGPEQALPLSLLILRIGAFWLLFRGMRGNAGFPPKRAIAA
jgi:hypothetical protein